MGTVTERYDIWTRFARVHLSTPAERSVYQALVGHGRESWSAEEIARARHLDGRDARDVLARFALAGIAETIGGQGQPPRYRWRAEMDYIFGGPADPDHPIDPVCGMPVVDTSPLAVEWDDRSFRFCSSLCRAAFLAFPSSFASPPHALRDARTPVSSPGGDRGTATGPSDRRASAAGPRSGQRTSPPRLARR